MREKIITLEKHNEQLLDIWSQLTSRVTVGNDADEEKFQVVEGKSAIHKKIKDMIKSAESEVVVVANQQQLGAFYHGEIIDYMESSAGGVDSRLLTCGQVDSEILDHITSCEIRILKSVGMCCVMVDKKQLLFITKEDLDSADLSAMWTDCKQLIGSISALYYKLWITAKPVETGRGSGPELILA